MTEKEKFIQLVKNVANTSIDCIDTGISFSYSCSGFINENERVLKSIEQKFKQWNIIFRHMGNLRFYISFNDNNIL